MQHATMATRAAVLALLFAGTSCGGGESGSMPPRSSTSTTPQASYPSAEQDAIPSQAEFDAQATKSINDQNADAEFNKLKKDIEGGG